MAASPGLSFAEFIGKHSSRLAGKSAYGTTGEKYLQLIRRRGCCGNPKKEFGALLLAKLALRPDTGADLT